MDRKLLPYEHQLIEALGVTKEEYLNFVDIQREYQDPKVGTQLDVRNADGGATVAIVLTVIGILFQVGAALLAPKPQVPSLDKGNRRNKREERFAPTFGFNSAQELAVYNDPVNLVYTNKGHNENGGIRIAGSLVWSELESFGSSQYMTMLLVLGASRVKQIEPDLTAFGQIAIKDLDPSLVLLFFRDYHSGFVQYKDVVFGVPQGKKNKPITQKVAFLPPSLKAGVEDETKVARLRPVTKKSKNGFSQAYTPTTAISFGAYDPVPIFVKIFGRDSTGDPKDAPNGVKIKDNLYPGSNGNIKVGDELKLVFQRLNDDAGDENIAENAAALREQYVDAIDYGATYMLGTAKFRLKNIQDNKRSLVNREAVFNFECIESGKQPSTDYNKDEVTDKQQVDFSVGTFINYRKFLNGGPNQDKAFSIKNLGLDYDFDSDDTVKWTDKNGNKKSKTVQRRGSINYSRELRRQENNDKPKLETAAKRKELRKDLRAQENLIEDIQEGKYDVYNDAPNQTAYAKTLSKQIKKAMKEDNKLVKLREEKERLCNEQVKVEQGNKSKQEKKKKLNNLQKKIELAQEEISSRERKVIKAQRRPWIDLTRNATKKYEAIDGKEYVTGIRHAENQLADEQVADNLFTDQKGANAIQKFYKGLIDEKTEALERVRDLIATWDTTVIDENNLASKNKSFFTKCLVKAESASYETVSEVDIVKFSLKATVFRRISGRQEKYGDEKTDFSASDNGVKSRTAFFRVKYKRVQDSAYSVFPVVFGVHRGTESAFYGQLNFEPEKTRQRWQFKFEPVFDLVAEMQTNGQLGVGFIESEGEPQKQEQGGVTWTWFGRKEYGFSFDGFPEAYQGSEGPKLTYEHNMFSNSSDAETQFSFNNGPEFTLAGVTEQQIATGGTETNGMEYKNLSTMGIIVRAGRGIEDLRSITAYVEKGKECYIVPDKPGGTYKRNQNSSSYAPDIFADTAIDTINGVGKYAPIVFTDNNDTADADAVLETEALIQAKNFCKNNNLPVEDGKKTQLFFDGIIADTTSWREFWIANAPFSLLEFVRKNGKEALVPAIPTNSAGRAAENDGRPVPLQISALFTTGNILEDSYKEEFLDYGPTTQDLVATVIYRETSIESVFDRKATVQVRLKDTGDDFASKIVTETFDASTFVTQKEQAIMIGKLLVNQRRHIRRGIEFKTFPSQDPLEPGAFIYVDVGNTSWDNYSSGIVMDGGKLNIPLHDLVNDGTYNFLLFDHKSGTTKKLNDKQVTNKKASSLSDYAGWMFVMGKDNPSKRVFRITEVALDEEGEVTVKAMEYPCDSGLRARIADFRSSNFKVS